MGYSSLKIIEQYLHLIDDEMAAEQAKTGPVDRIMGDWRRNTHETVCICRSEGFGAEVGYPAYTAGFSGGSADFWRFLSPCERMKLSQSRRPQ